MFSIELLYIKEMEFKEFRAVLYRQASSQTRPLKQAKIDYPRPIAWHRRSFYICALCWNQEMSQNPRPRSCPKHLYWQSTLCVDVKYQGSDLKNIRDANGPHRLPVLTKMEAKDFFTISKRALAEVTIVLIAIVGGFSEQVLIFISFIV